MSVLGSAEAWTYTTTRSSLSSLSPPRSTLSVQSSTSPTSFACSRCSPPLPRLLGPRRCIPSTGQLKSIAPKLIIWRTALGIAVSSQSAGTPFMSFMLFTFRSSGPSTAETTAVGTAFGWRSTLLLGGTTQMWPSGSRVLDAYAFTFGSSNKRQLGTTTSATSSQPVKFGTCIQDKQRHRCSGRTSRSSNAKSGAIEVALSRKSGIHNPSSLQVGCDIFIQQVDLVIPPPSVSSTRDV
ncbi:hypothetical protein K466DRAFT_309163 [Polyporus arcularius HHB13444]|uniref:Uncharacterized protein n=1 Tax=Polyporus arcularius HHB13444 TaxID=1314778 RepID=A0A5C3PPT3_9APHY|nr:hypothetical protein K466DRAFT_309163 [Polyporus arcularius HHB13444]